ncbi:MULTISPECIES: helix-turn-helix domain-containing protein [unclassified Haloferax]|uniref:TrmB family transcriptional regulator n=1 Tax=unclassified Haloferax TaxID=2625095 RepID=UPI002874806A|nr:MULTISPECIES: helix-turn-helix domain-containing protein [unclassified Haloferax]MDS0243827.1 TrmB family transcriptional regulator [Haloferax sp. S2CR25]MDS0446948.1 TrmB family transcriptional regulator [Haloferax sp. S2CR25-2]
MSTDSGDDFRSVAIEQLEQFGLSAYAARTFVALTSLGIGTATEISEVSEVPRTRVYDAVDELRERGLVDVQQSSPKKFWVVSAETTCQKFEQEMRQRTSLLTTALQELGTAQRKQEQRGVWTVEGQPAVTDRVLEFIGGAEDEIVYMTVEGLLTEDVTEALSEAAHRGVSIRLAGVSPDVQDTLHEEIPEAELFDTLWMWSDTPAGRLMMVDGTQTLVSVLVNGRDAAPSDPRSETAIWGAGETNSLVAVLRAIFTWRLENDDLDD